MMRRHGRRQREQRSAGRRPRHGGYRPLRDRRTRGAVGGRVRGRLLGGAARRPGGDPAPPRGHPARDGRGHPCPRRGRGAAVVRDDHRGRARPRARRDRRRSRPGDRARDRGARHRRPGRRQRRDGGPQGVPARQRPEPHQPQRTLHRDHREHDARRRGHDGHAAVDDDPLERGRDPDRAAPDVARHEDRDGLRQARAEGAVRPAGRGRGRRPTPPGQATAELARGARADVRQDRPDPLDATGPDAARVHRGARDPPGQRASPDRGAGRPRDGAGARRAVGGRVRDDRPAAAGGRHDRAGAPRDPRRPHEGRRQGAAPRREGADRTGPRAARGVRREGVRASRSEAGRGHAGGVRAPVRVAAPRARLPARGREHRADGFGDRGLLAAAGAGGVRGLLDLAAPGDAGHRRRTRRVGARGARAQGGGPPAARVLLQADPRRRLLPRRPAPGEPDVAARRRRRSTSSTSG